MEINPATLTEIGDSPDELAETLTKAGYEFQTLNGDSIESLSIYCKRHARASTMILGIPHRRPPVLSPGAPSPYPLNHQ